MDKLFTYENTRYAKLKTLRALLNWFGKAYPNMDGVVYAALVTILDAVNDAFEKENTK